MSAGVAHVVRHALTQSVEYFRDINLLQEVMDAPSMAAVTTTMTAASSRELLLPCPVCARQQRSSKLLSRPLLLLRHLAPPAVPVSCCACHCRCPHLRS